MSILRIGGKDPQGNAKGFNVDNDGNIDLSRKWFEPEEISFHEDSTTAGYSPARDVSGLNYVLIEVSGSFSGSMRPVCRARANSSNRNILARTLDGDDISAITSQGSYLVNVSGFQRMYIQITSISSGSITVVGNGTSLSILEAENITHKLEERTVTPFENRNIEGYSGAINSEKFNYALIEVTGSFNLNLQVYGRIKGSDVNYILYAVDTDGRRVKSLSTGVYRVNIAGFNELRMRVTDYVSGSVTVRATMVVDGSFYEEESNYKDTFKSYLIDTIKPGLQTNDVLVFEDEPKNVCILNTSSYSPIEIMTDTAFQTGVLTDKNKRIRLEPGEVIHFSGRRITEIRYGCKIGVGSMSVYTSSAKIDVSDRKREHKYEIDTYGRNDDYDTGSPIRPTVMYAQQNVIMYRDDDNRDTVFVSTNGGRSIVNKHTFANELSGISFITLNNTLIVMQSDGVGGRIMFRSTDYGATWTQVGTFDRGWHNANSIHMNYKGHIIWAEYGSEENVDYKVWKSDDHGATWTESFSQPGRPTAGGIRHWHTAAYDAIKNRWIVTSGDTDEECRWYKSDDDGDTWQLLASGTQLFRTLGKHFTDGKHVYWATDSTFGHLYMGIYKTTWAKLESAEFDPIEDTEQLLKTAGTPYAFWAYENTLIVGSEPSINSTTQRVPITSPTIYVSKDLGKSWDVACVWDYDPDVPLPERGWRAPVGMDSQHRVYVPIHGDMYGRNTGQDFPKGMTIKVL